VYVFYILCCDVCLFFFFSSRRRHTRFSRDWSSDVCSSDLAMRNRIFWLAAVLTAVIASPASAHYPYCTCALEDGKVACKGGFSRSEERRVGKECRAGWGADQSKRKEV